MSGTFDRWKNKLKETLNTNKPAQQTSEQSQEDRLDSEPGAAKE